MDWLRDSIPSIRAEFELYNIVTAIYTVCIKIYCILVEVVDRTRLLLKPRKRAGFSFSSLLPSQLINGALTCSSWILTSRRLRIIVSLKQFSWITMMTKLVLYLFLLESILYSGARGAIASDEINGIDLPGWNKPLPSKHYSGYIHLSNNSSDSGKYFHYW